MDLSNEELLKLPYKVSGNIDYLKTYPELFRLPEFSETNRSLVNNFNATMKYIILMYSYKTPLMNLPDYFKRREYAKEFSKVREDDIANATSLIIGYLRMTKSHKWSLFCVLNDSFYNIAGRLQADRTESGERSGALRTNLKGTQEDIETLYNELLNDDPNVKIREAIIESAEEYRILDFRPEMIAMNKENGEPPLQGFNPYQKKDGRRGRKRNPKTI